MIACVLWFVAPLVVAAGNGEGDDSIIATAANRPDAQIMILKVPGPRGSIVDRNGKALATSVVKQQVVVNFPAKSFKGEQNMLDWVRRLQASLPEGLATLNVEDSQIKNHYEYRRWVPLAISGYLSDEEAWEIEGSLSPSLSLNSVYVRVYPEGDLAAHMIGYLGIKEKPAKRAIEIGDLKWELHEGRAGWEKIYEEELAGKSGWEKIITNENGKIIFHEVLKTPAIGGVVRTTLDLDLQRAAESALKKLSKKGALVIIDIQTGEVVAMASNPSYDPNLFLPKIKYEAYQELLNSKDKPLYARSYQAAYPPASVFKAVVALAGLQLGFIDEGTLIDGPPSLEIGGREFKNWNKKPEGEINVIDALKRSCNTWFFELAIYMKSKPFMNLAKHLGLGEKSDLALLGETAGKLPNLDYEAPAQSANLSIGQGDLLTSPLQVARMMAGIARGMTLPKLQLIQQVVTSDGNVVEQGVLGGDTPLPLGFKSVVTVHKGLDSVVNDSRGTGKKAAVSYARVSGKTGTAQWGNLSKKQNLAWFAGFMPSNKPKYAFAAIYEGDEGEVIGGGSFAAPIVKEFFEQAKPYIEPILQEWLPAAFEVNEGDQEAASQIINTTEESSE